jgi:ferredoxin
MSGFVQLCIDKFTVVGPKVKQTRYAYGQITDPGELVLDHDVTISSPKKYFFPAKETLLKFNLGTNDFQAVCEAEEVMLLGVHPYDINAIQALDVTMNYDGKPDVNYTKKREKSMIIGMDFLPHKLNFSKSMGQHELTEKSKKITDIFITLIGDRYLMEAYSEKGKELLNACTTLKDVTEADEHVLAVVNSKKNDAFTHAINMTTQELHDNLKKSWNSSVWHEFTEKCFGCGSCNLVCPTCYCFDVEDDIELNGQDGHRERTWDSCMLLKFAEVAGGENFREDRMNRLRHRLMKKGMYMTEKYGEPGCVGCGRCTIACTADIDPVEVFNRIKAVVDSE